MTSGSGDRAPFGRLGVMRNWRRTDQNADPGPQRSLAARSVSWVIFIGVTAYFLLPLVATFLHSIKPVINDVPDPTLAYRTVLASPNFYGGLLYSFTAGIVTIILSLLIIVPTAYWVRLRAPLVCGACPMIHGSNCQSPRAQRC